MLNLLVLLGSFALCPGHLPVPVQLPSDTIGPLQVYRSAGDPLLVIRVQDDPPLVAIRLAIPVIEAPGEIGAGRVLQLLVEDRARSEVRRFGGHLELMQSPSHLVYMVTGPVTALNEMVAILRYLISPPGGQPGAVGAAWLTARRSALAGSEAPDLVIRQRLEGALFPDLVGRSPPIDRVEPPDHSLLEWFWRRWFRPEEISVVVVGAVEPSVARAAFTDWPPPPPAGDQPMGELPNDPSPPVAEVIAPRVGLGYPGGSIEPAVLAIAAALINNAIPALELRDAAAEFWWLGDRRAIVLTGASPLEDQLNTFELRVALQLAVADIAAGVGDDDLRAARSRLSRSLLMRGRTPWGLASLIGEFLERTGDPYGAARFLEALERVGLEDLRSALRTLIYARPVTVELEP